MSLKTVDRKTWEAIRSHFNFVKEEEAKDGTESVERFIAETALTEQSREQFSK